VLADLEAAGAVGGADLQRLDVTVHGHLRLPELPALGRESRFNRSVLPGTTTVETELDTRDAAIPGEGDAGYLQGPSRD
jgi:hypothetical protein